MNCLCSPVKKVTAWYWMYLVWIFSVNVFSQFGAVPWENFATGYPFFERKSLTVPQNCLCSKLRGGENEVMAKKQNCKQIKHSRQKFSSVPFWFNRSWKPLTHKSLMYSEQLTGLVVPSSAVIIRLNYREREENFGIFRAKAPRMSQKIVLDQDVYQRVWGKCLTSTPTAPSLICTFTRCPLSDYIAKTREQTILSVTLDRLLQSSEFYTRLSSRAGAMFVVNCLEQCSHSFIKLFSKASKIIGTGWIIGCTYYWEAKYN